VLRALYDGASDVGTAVWQLLSPRELPTGRFRAFVSDGVQYMVAMLPADASAMMKSGQLKDGSLIRCSDPQVHESKGRR
jgi:hypothetical protein